MTTVRDTSLHAYRTEILPELGERQLAVYEFLLREGPSTTREIAKWFGCDACSITGRIDELRKAKLLTTEEKKRKCGVTGRTAYAWDVIRDTLF